MSLRSRFLLQLASIFLTISGVFAEGSKNLTPSYGTGDGTTNNNFIGYLCHSQEGGITGNFLVPGASADERLYVYMKQGETLYMGLRRIDPVTNFEQGLEDLTIVIRQNDGTLVTSFTLTADQTVNAGAGSQGYAFQTPQTGVIESYASVLAGPQQVVGASGYDALEWTNASLGDQEFYIEFIQFNGGSTNASDDIYVESWYDLWDFSVYNNNEEKPGRLHSKNWGFTAGSYTNQFADDFKMYVKVPSTIAGQSSGSYIKMVDFAGIQPYTTLVYANSIGAKLASTSDLNGDGVVDFLDTRMSQAGNIGELEYDMFINNPDINQYPTTTLPEISITDANFYCNPNGTSGAGAITFTTNQSGIITILLDLNGTTGYQDGTADVIIEQEIDASSGTAISTVIWDGLDGTGATVPSGTSMTISGRFTSGPLHVPLFDPEINLIGVNMVDVRPATSFNLIYWDDRAENPGLGSPSDVEFDGTNNQQHTWNNGNGILVNTWSFGYYQINTQNVTFTYACDIDGDGITGSADLDSDNDGILDSVEGDYSADTDGDGIPDYLDADANGDGVVNASDNWADTNGDGVNDYYDTDLDGIPNALDLDSDNDGIQDIIEAGGIDSNGDGMTDSFSDASGGFAYTDYTVSSGCSTSLISTSGFTTLSMNDDQTQSFTLPFKFEFFGNQISANSTVYLNSNGWLSFDNTGQDGSFYSGGVAIPDGSFTNTIFLNRQDYDPSSATGGGTITYGVSGTSPNRIFVIDFSNVLIYGGTAGEYQSIQLQLYESTYDVRMVTSFLTSSGGTRTMGINLDGATTPYFVTGRNNASYSIGSVECQSFLPNYTTPTPNGVDDTIDASPLPLTDTDGDGTPNYLDLDSDNDGIVDTWEAGGTADSSTGQISGFNDTNGNGWNDTQETVALTLPDTDGDGSLADYLDIDADNDGIPDNYEGQSSDSTITIAAGDTDNNGLLDVYDPNNGGTFITPVDTDGDGTYDFRDTDADGDGVIDLIEGWDANANGFGDWDATGSNNDITDETGYNTDTDADGLWDIFDNNSGTGIANIIGSDVTRQNTDGADLADWQDEDDDNDGSLTAGEDVNSNGDWTDDFTQGQGASATIPDYLFRGDYDGDSLFDKDDADSDNDGILDSEEDNGESIDPSGDDDNDGIANYKDADVAGSLSSSADSNGDGVFDVFDTDLDGVPDFLDLDSDNDGIWDAVEAYEGSVPNGLNQTTGMFELNDPDNDGLMNYVDSAPAAIGGTSTLANPDSDSDGIKDYLDIDSDGDGIVDLIESQSTSSLVYLADKDTDGDGIDDNFDPSNGGTLITPVNSDGLDLQDYLDSDSDNDNVLDIVEGDDGNFNGFGDWDDNQNGVADEADMSTDADGDGLADAFDNITLGSDNNEVGSNAALQNTDNLDELDFRDTDDDGDGKLTKNEDANSNGNYADDHTDGQGISTIPDYLYSGDFDGDGISNYVDLDDDNDGITDTNEGYQGVTLTNGSFESPVIGTSTYSIMDESLLPGWNTTATDNQVEVWSTGFNGVPSYDGNQFMEINANLDARLYQDVTTEPGSLIYWTIAHRGRSGTDEFRILIGPTSAPLDNGTFATGNTAWVVYSGYYKVPAGQTTTRFAFESVSTASGNASIGNFIDDFQLYTAGSGYDADGDGLPDYLDRDSDNDGVADINEAGGIDTNGDGVVDSFTDTDNDGLHDPYDDNNGGVLLTSRDTDSDGLEDTRDLDSDNDGVPDLTESGGTDTNGDGKVDSTTDTDSDGLADVVDPDNGGTPLTTPDTDYDGNKDYQDLDSDNDGITDAVENGALDTNADGLIDDYASDADGDGLADSVDPDSGGSPIANVDTDGDGIEDFRDLDADNDGYPDIMEAGGTDTDHDGIVDALLDINHNGIPASVDVLQTGGTDADGDGIDDNYDVTYTGGNDDDGDGIDNIYDKDKDGNGYSDAVESNPYAVLDTDGDGHKNFKDLDSDNDGIVDVIEFGMTADTNTGTISGFTDSDNDGLNDAQDGYIGTSANGSVAAITPVNSDTGTEPSVAVTPDYLDIDSDNDGIVDLYEAQTKNTLVSLSGIDVDKNGLDDAFDPNQGNTLITPVNTDGTGSADYLDDDSDGDSIIDLIEGDNANKDQYGDWDSNKDNNFTDSGYDKDTDSDGLLDIFDDVASTGNSNVTGSNAAVQDTDHDGTWDFQDTDDDNDAKLTGPSGPDLSSISEDPGGVIPDYLNGNNDVDNDGIVNFYDLDADNDGLANTSEDGGTGIDPGADDDSDGLLNFEDMDIDGDGITNAADSNTSGVSTTSFTDTNNDGVIDQFDKDMDAVPDYKDRDSDNDGIADILELGLTDANKDGTLDEGSGITDANGNGFEDAYDPSCDGTTVVTSVNADSQTNSGVTNANNALGAIDANYAELRNNDILTLHLSTVVTSGNTIVIRLSDPNGGSNGAANIEQSANGTSFSNTYAYSATANAPSTEDINYVLTADAQYIRITRTNNRVAVYGVDYSYSTVACGGTIGTALTTTDTDSDGYDDYLDLDSDNDGIVDNVESQLSSSYVTPVWLDSDGDGIMDVYDEDVAAGNAIVPVNTDGTGNADYIDTDSDDDGVADVIEGWDSDQDGFGDWDTNSNNDPTDETGYSADIDKDGISYLFDTNNGKGSMANIIGTGASVQDTDSDNIPDYRDIDDDGDTFNTSAEDNNSNLDWTDDFTQGGVTIPNYLFNPDNDGDGIMDAVDLDSDNDGILNTDEYNGTTYASGSSFPFDDDDGDGIYNYLDSDAANFADSNHDGVDDRVDHDRDGVPDFFDLDSDNDGIVDAIEANDGIVPGNFDSGTARFTDIDTDNDGLVDEVDSDNGGTPLANSDSDSDGLKDYLDLDSDNDGITDNREGQTTSGFITITNTDTDTNGLKDVYDPNQGATIITPTNTDGDSGPVLPDYLDTDSDNDNVPDVIEGFDANKNGFSDLDLNLNGSITDETGYGTDVDGDGLEKLFDNYSGTGIANIKGSKATLQDTDLDGILDWRDDEDDSDGILTSAEDTGDGAGGPPDGIYWNDKTQGGGATPDYLFFNDTDHDGIADGQDLDSDNDGIIDDDEASGVTYSGASGPFDDDDSDGLFNYLDSDATNFVDADNDGIDDRVDQDGDGIPNFFDLDSDNDGIPDGVEANSGSLPTAQNDNGQYPSTVADVDNDGLADVIDLGSTSSLANPDTDGDGLPDFLDLDSDNDGITDLFEAGGNDYNGDGKLDAFGDTDGDGLGNSVDSDNGGSALPYTDTDTDGAPNYIDTDSENDGNPDYEEGFYEADPASDVNSYIARVTAYNAATSSSNTYPTTDSAPANGKPDYLDDNDGDGIPNLLDPVSTGTSYYFDDDNDGIINLFDPDQSGDFYGNVSGQPDRDGDGIPNILDTNDIPLPLDFLSFRGSQVNNSAVLIWETTNEVNVSHFEVMRSTDGKTFSSIGVRDAVNVKDKLNTYQFTDKNAVDGYNFYQIREVDFDGKDGYTKIINVTMSKQNITWNIYPNPTSDVVNVQSNVIIPDSRLILMDVQGRIIHDTSGGTENTIELDIREQPAGSYFLIIELPDGRKTFRIIKQ